MTEKWRWMMDWCAQRHLHPGEKDNWKDAKKAYLDVYGQLNLSIAQKGIK